VPTRRNLKAHLYWERSIPCRECATVLMKRVKNYVDRSEKVGDCFIFNVGDIVRNIRAVIHSDTKSDKSELKYLLVLFP